MCIDSISAIPVWGVAYGLRWNSGYCVDIYMLGEGEVLV